MPALFPKLAPCNICSIDHLAVLRYLGYTLRKSPVKMGEPSGGKAMFSLRATAAILISTVLVAPPAFATNVHRSPTSGQTHAHKLAQSKHRTRRARGQQAIQPERVTQIQQALIREHYLTGETNGKWDTTTIAAMQKYQADHGWQTKLMPDSRALMKLGLGPDYSTAINAKDSSFAVPPSSSTTPAPQNSGFVAGSGVNQ
jgi:hypothetical protein